MMSASPAVSETLEQIGLRYTHSGSPGIRRLRDGDNFTYRDAAGRLVKNPAELARIEKLGIPPAYEQVWICSDPQGHLQATGVDSRGRKQYRYHEQFRRAQEETKFHRMADFGRALPSIRERVRRDLALRGLPRDKVLAVVVRLLERSLIRVGNEEYARENHSFGLTTMLTDHVDVHGETLQFNFLGKSRKWHHIEVHDRRLGRIIKQIQELPGQELFHYLDSQGNPQTIGSSDVNAYLSEAAGGHFTAKDFRTWWASLLTLSELLSCECGASSASVKRAVASAVKSVAKQLGNTPSVCRRAYIHPIIIESFERQDLIERARADELIAGKELEQIECALLACVDASA